MDLLHGFLTSSRIGLHMPANRFNGYTDYGVGIGLRVPHYDHILSKKPVVDWFEIISENYMVDGGRPLKILDQILDQYRVVQHGVSMYFGSAQPSEPRSPKADQGTDEANEDSMAVRSPLLGQRRWPLYARPAAASVYIRSDSHHGRARSHGTGLS